ncbi:MAG TPA: peptidoglycan recognition family protein [Planctomycetota bacterium]|jgi:hypothetical protein
MSALFDFFAGIANGVRSKPGGKPAAPSTTVRVRGGRRRSTRRSSLDSVGRFCVLMLGITCGTVALLAAGKKPSAHVPDNEPPHSALPSPATTSLDEVVATNPAAAPRTWQYIVIHHSGTHRGSAHSFDQYHRIQRGWAGGLGYHFVIGNGNDQGDGVIVAGPRWRNQEAGAHANSTEHNEHGIGICLVGNFDEYPPTPAQVSAARALIARLAHDYQIPAENIVGHGQIRRGGGTACPGKFLNVHELRD